MNLGYIFLIASIFFPVESSFAQVIDVPLYTIGDTSRECGVGCAFDPEIQDCVCNTDLNTLKDEAHSPGQEKMSSSSDNWLGTGIKSTRPSTLDEGTHSDQPNWWIEAAAAGSRPSTLVIGRSANAPLQSAYSETNPGTYQNFGGNYLWIEDVRGRAQYLSIPQYSQISLIASTPNGGYGAVYELCQSTTSQGTYNVYTISLRPGNNQIGFDASVLGRHIVLFIVNDQASNAVIVDVGGNY